MWINSAKYSKPANPERDQSIWHRLASPLAQTLHAMPPRRTATITSSGTTPTASSFTTPEASGSEAENDPPAVIVSPIRRRQRNAAPSVRSKSDADVWDLADEALIG